MCCRFLLVILLFIWLMVAFGDSVRPAGKDTSHKQDNQKSNPCPDPHNPDMSQRPDITIEGKDGETVLLPCSREDKMDISNKKIEWFKGPTTEDKPIHKYIQRSDPRQTPRDDFEGLTSLFEEELSSGDCSLNLRVTTSHSGSYYCCVPGRLYCLVNLKVHPKGKRVKRNDGIDGLTAIYWTIGFIVIGGSFITGVGCWWHKRRKRHNHRKRNRSGGNSNSPQTHQEVLPLQAQQPPQDEGNEPADQDPQEQMLMDVIVDQGDPADGNVRSRSHRSSEN